MTMDQMDPWQAARSYNPDENLTDQVNAERDARLAQGAKYGDPDDLLIDSKAAALAGAVKQGKKVFCSPSKRDGYIMVRPGQLAVVYAGTNTPVVPGAPATNGTETKRVGDIKARFAGSLLIIDPNTVEGQVVLEWAERHPDICRDAMDPSTDVWMAMKESQLNTAVREPSMPTNIDVDAVLRGDLSGFQERGSVAARARSLLASGTA